MAIIENMSFTEYCMIDAVNSSTIKTVFAKSPAHAKAQVWKDTTPLRKGSGLHTEVLEPTLFNDRFYRIPDVNKRKNEGKAEIEFVANQNPGKLGLELADIQNIKLCGNALRCHPFVAPMLKDSKKEVVLTWEEDFGLCKARLDMLRPREIGDLKSTRDAHLLAFGREIFRMDRLYWIQAAIYFRGARMNKLPVDTFTFIACELIEPYAITLSYMDEYTLQESWAKIYPYMERWAEAKKTGVYNAYPPVKNQIVLPEWMADETATGDDEDGDE